jgi:threonyl-tRNA synthetase
MSPLDMNLPDRFGIDFVDEDGQRRRPVMLHRALFGSLERFTGILIEHHAGKLPPWLSPVQAMVLSITDQHGPYANDIATLLRGSGIRAEADSRNEKIGYKIREHTLRRIPYLLVVGTREMETGQVAIRTRDGDELGVMGLDQALTLVTAGTEPPDAAVRAQRQQGLMRHLREVA